MALNLRILSFATLVFVELAGRFQRCRVRTIWLQDQDRYAGKQRLWFTEKRKNSIMKGKGCHFRNSLFNFAASGV